MSSSRTAMLDRADIGKLFEHIWVAKSATLEEESAQYEPQCLCTSLLNLQGKLDEIVRSLPAIAFERQPDEVDGSDVWSAGEIIGHLVEVELDAIPFWEAVAGRTGDPPPAGLLDVADRPPRTRASCLASVHALAEFGVRTYPRFAKACGGDEQGVHFALGQVSVRAALLGTCLHTLDHLNQLESLRELV